MWPIMVAEVERWPVRMSQLHFAAALDAIEEIARVPSGVGPRFHRPWRAMAGFCDGP